MFFAVKRPLHRCQKHIANKSVDLGRRISSSSETNLAVYPVMFWCRIVANIVASHVLTIFYAKRFVWQDFNPSRLAIRFYSLVFDHNEGDDVETRLKAILIFLLLRFGGVLQVRQVHWMTVLLAIPQLYRLRMFRDFRVILGPLTPILALLNIAQEQSWVTVTCLTLSLTAFVVLRPDNTKVLDLVLWVAKPTSFIVKFLDSPMNRRKLHGALAVCNTSVAILVLAAPYPELYRNASFFVSDKQSLLHLSHNLTCSTTTLWNAITLH